jgi:hypothetical protein
MICDNDPSIEQMEKDLLGGGWIPSRSGTRWIPLWGDSCTGPHKAWHIWHGGLKEWLAVENEKFGGPQC